jgi:DNA-binding GntR family transcriptional regulator
MISPVRPLVAAFSLREQIRNVLLDRIARGELQSGDRIIESRLVEEFGVSSTPVREAIRELVAMGILQAANHKGASVREVSVTETIEAFRVRAALEALAAETATAELLACGMGSQLRRMAEQIVESAKVRDFGAFQSHNQSFHRTIVSHAGNSVLLRVWDSLAFQIRTRFTMDFLTTVDPVALAREHLPIVEAIERGDQAQAAALLASHSKHVVEYLEREVLLAQHSGEAARSLPLPLSHSRPGAL